MPKVQQRLTPNRPLFFRRHTSDPSFRPLRPSAVGTHRKNKNGGARGTTGEALTMWDALGDCVRDGQIHVYRAMIKWLFAEQTTDRLAGEDKESRESQHVGLGKPKAQADGGGPVEDEELDELIFLLAKTGSRRRRPSINNMLVADVLKTNMVHVNMLQARCVDN